ncbi:MAG: hypothetical protein ACI8PT_000128 [Gammaproteobacteria bacterium]|jgi:hypothetical protein
MRSRAQQSVENSDSKRSFMVDGKVSNCRAARLGLLNTAIGQAGVGVGLPQASARLHPNSCSLNGAIDARALARPLSDVGPRISLRREHSRVNAQLYWRPMSGAVRRKEER